MMKTLPGGGVVGGDVVIFFCGLKNGGANAGKKLLSAGDDTIFRIFVMPPDGGLHIEADTHDEDQAGSCLGKKPVRPRLDIEWGKVCHRR